MTILPTEGNEPAISLTAIKTGLTYYDASYMYTAKTLGLTLATEDTQLKTAANQTGTPTTSLDELT